MASDKPFGVSWIRSSHSHGATAECVEAAAVLAGARDHVRARDRGDRRHQATSSRTTLKVSGTPSFSSTISTASLLDRVPDLHLTAAHNAPPYADDAGQRG